MDHDHDDDNIPSNKSGNKPFSEVLQSQTTRRNVIIGGLTVASAAFLYSCFRSSGRLVDFEPVKTSEGHGSEPTISEDYEYQVLIPWGTPLKKGIPAYNGDPNSRPTAAEQAQMVGIGHDGMHFFPINEQGGASKNQHGLLCINHEFGTNQHVLGRAEPRNMEDVRLSQHAHGMSVVNISQRNDKWRSMDSPYNRRIHVNTPVRFSGPVAGHSLLQTPNGNIPMGTVNNCSSGYTPWNTYLTCEENFNKCFSATQEKSTWHANEQHIRYGIKENGSSYGWHKFDRRFDLSDPDFKNEENRFGWIVEVDPFDPNHTPVKRTALGRLKHEGAAVTVGRDDRVVVYMGDDQAFDYIYKFVSEDSWKVMRENGVSPLDKGKLYVAKFHEDGTGEWLELTMENNAIAKKFNDQAEVLTFARMAADVLGATPMDRPEWISVAPDGEVYCTLTNNKSRTGTHAANPTAPNTAGHIIRWKDSSHFTGTKFTWDVFLVAENTHKTNHAFSSPDGLWADPDGRLFIQTDGGQEHGLNNQMLVADTRTGEIRRLLTGVTGDEITGITATPDRESLFCNIQHPGKGDPTLTNFPAKTDGKTIPRDCTLVIRKRRGGVVGS